MSTPARTHVTKAELRWALWEVGDLSWALHERQLEDEAFRDACYAAGIRRIVELCGRRYGKTRGLVVDAFQQAIRFPGSRLPYAAKTWDSACAYVIPEARYLIDHAPAATRPEIVDGQIRFHTRSLIDINGSDTVRNADNLRGPAARRVYVDEGGFNDQLEYVCNDVLQAQLMTTDGMMIVASSAPRSPSHAFAKMVARAERRGSLIKRTTEDAPHLTQQQIDSFAEELGGRNSTSWLREAMCEIVVDETRAIVPEWRLYSEDCTGVIEAPEHRWWWVAADLGYRDGTAILLGWVHFAGLPNGEGGLTGPVLVVEDEKVLKRPTSHDVQEATAKLEAKHHARVRGRVADAPPITVADLRRLQGRLGHGESDLYWRPPRKDDLEGAVNQVRLLVRRGQLVVHPRCTTLLSDLRSGVWDEKREAFERVVSEDGAWHYDALAALVYLARSVDMTLCPDPAGFVPPRGVRPHPGEMSRAEVLSRGTGTISLRRRRA